MLWRNESHRNTPNSTWILRHNFLNGFKILYNTFFYFNLNLYKTFWWMVIKNQVSLWCTKADKLSRNGLATVQAFHSKVCNFLGAYRNWTLTRNKLLDAWAGSWFWTDQFYSSRNTCWLIPLYWCQIKYCHLIKKFVQKSSNENIITFL